MRPLGRMQAQGVAATGASQHSGWQTITTGAELTAALANAKQNGQPLMLDWYADWCISCKVIEREVLTDPTVGAQLKDYQLVRFDMTDSNPAQRALLDSYKLFGPPAILLFDKQGAEIRDLRVVGEIDAETFAARLTQARERF